MKVPKPIRVLIADDHTIVRDGLSVILGLQPDIKVVAEAADGEEACALFQQHRPDMMLLDLRMPKLDGLEVLCRIRSRDPAARIVIVSICDSDEDIFRSLQAGAQGYMLKDAARREYIEAVRNVFAGENYIPARIASKVVGHLQNRQLTTREVEVIQRIARGGSNKEVGAALSISEGTVKTHVKSLLTKLEATSRTEAVTIGRQRGFIRD